MQVAAGRGSTLDARMVSTDTRASRLGVISHRLLTACALPAQVWHTHCRVGYDHGPQVADPRAPEWIPYMEGHERWWDAIWKAQKARGQKVSPA